MRDERFHRRLIILRGKRKGCFDRDQYYLEGAPRARAARKVRTLLRTGRPVVLVTPRWSLPQRFLDDIAVDLSLGKPVVNARCLWLFFLQGKPPVEAWAWLLRALAEFIEVSPSQPAMHPVDSTGFRYRLLELMARMEGGTRSALLVHGLEYLHLDVRNDLIAAFEEHAARVGRRRRFNLLLATAVEQSHLEVMGAERVWLSDYGLDEGIDALVEWVGKGDPDVLREVVLRVGGVPALLDAVGGDAQRNGNLAATPDATWRSLGLLGDELRKTYDLVEAHKGLGERFEEVMRAAGGWRSAKRPTTSCSSPGCSRPRARGSRGWCG